MRFIFGVLIGGAAGAALGLIIAPRPGKETREALQRRLRQTTEGLVTAESEPVRASQA